MEEKSAPTDFLPSHTAGPSPHDYIGIPMRSARLAMIQIVPATMNDKQQRREQNQVQVIAVLPETDV